METNWTQMETGMDTQIFPNGDPNKQSNGDPNEHSNISKWRPKWTQIETQMNPNRPKWRHKWTKWTPSWTHKRTEMVTCPFGFISVNLGQRGYLCVHWGSFVCSFGYVCVSIWVHFCPFG